MNRVPVPLASVVGRVVHDCVIGQVLEQLPPQGARVGHDRGVGGPGPVVEGLVPVALGGYQMACSGTYIIYVLVLAIATFHTMILCTAVKNPSIKGCSELHDPAAWQPTAGGRAHAT